jgi:hypothetical protein
MTDHAHEVEAALLARLRRDMHLAAQAREEGMRPMTDKVVGQYAKGLLTHAELIEALASIDSRAPRLCPSCGTTPYTAGTIADAVAGSAKVDMNPTHACPRLP